MSQGNDFANYSAASNAGPGGSEEVWFVAVASDDIKQMTIDQLDEAFRLGVITGETPVWTEGMEAWQPLSQVADLDADAGGDHGSSNHGSSSSNQNDEHAPASPGNTGAFATANGSGGNHANGGASNGRGNGGGTGSFASASGFGAVTLQSVQHSFAPGPNSMAPVTSSYAPSGQVGLGSAPPVVGGDEELPAPKRGGFRPARWAIAGAAAVVVIGVVAYNNLSSSVASAGTDAAHSSAPALAARPYDGADGADKAAASAAAKSEGRAADTSEAAIAAADKPVADAPGSGSGSAAVTRAGAAAATTAKAALVASSDDEEDAPSKKGADKDSLRSTFSKSLSNKKEKPAKASKVKPRKTASRASTKSRAKPKKSTVVRTQSAFDPLNDSLP